MGQLSVPGNLHNLYTGQKWFLKILIQWKKQDW